MVPKLIPMQRTWAKNADEYLCWDLVPKEALVKFVPYENLTQQGDKHVINIEFARGVSWWRDTIPSYSPRYLDTCERLFNVHLKAAGVVTPSTDQR